MWNYIIRRVVQALFILLIITGVCWTLTRLSSDPLAQYGGRQGVTAADREALRHRLGLDQPLPVQYFAWLSLVLHGELGDSFFSHQPVALLLSQRLPMTIVLMFTAEFFTVILALLLGVIA